MRALVHDGLERTLGIVGDGLGARDRLPNRDTIQTSIEFDDAGVVLAAVEDSTRMDREDGTPRETHGCAGASRGLERNVDSRKAGDGVDRLTCRCGRSSGIRGPLGRPLARGRRGERGDQKSLRAIAAEGRVRPWGWVRSGA
jgi:hypothetical protein